MAMYHILLIFVAQAYDSDDYHLYIQFIINMTWQSVVTYQGRLWTLLTTRPESLSHAYPNTNIHLQTTYSCKLQIVIINLIIIIISFLFLQLATQIVLKLNLVLDDVLEVVQMSAVHSIALLISHA